MPRHDMTPRQAMFADRLMSQASKHATEIMEANPKVADVMTIASTMCGIFLSGFDSAEQRQVCADTLAATAMKLAAVLDRMAE